MSQKRFRSNTVTGFVTHFTPYADLEGAVAKQIAILQAQLDSLGNSPADVLKAIAIGLQIPEEP